MHISAILTRSIAFAALAIGLVACGSSSTSYRQDEATANVGVYAPPPPGAPRIKAGVPPFIIEDEDLAPETAAVAADQLTSLAVLSQRFTVIERAQLQQLLNEQGLEGIVRADELASAGQVRGVDALLFGKITNFQVKRTESRGGVGIATIGNVVGVGDYDQSESAIHVEIGVDLRLVDPETGGILAAHFGEFTRTDEVSSFGIEILGANASSGSSLQIDEENRGKLLRLALDSTLRKMLPQIDAHLRSLPSTNAAPASTSGGGTSGGEETASKFCTQCGNKIPQSSSFCSKCGAQQ